MPRETMTCRERWQAVLRRQTPDRVPMSYRATPEATAKLLQHLGCDFDEAMRRLHVDHWVGVSPKYVGPALPPGEDVYGMRRRKIDYGTGSYDEFDNHPLAAFETVGEIEKSYRWPSPDWWDYSELPRQLEGQETRPVIAGGSEPFLYYKALRGEEQAYIDLVANPEIVDYCLGKLFDLAYQSTRRIYEAIPGQVLMSYVAEDLGSQQSLLISREHIRRFLRPHMKRMIDLAHQGGARVFHHDDGAIREIIPDMIDIGIDLLDPIQWRLPGMDREGLKRDFGSRVIFHGAMDNQVTLPFGTVADVRREVEENYRILGAGGGFILGPCHNIQAVGPAENVVAMYETGFALGWRP